MGRWERGFDGKPAFQADDGRLFRRDSNGKIVTINQLSKGKSSTRPSRIWVITITVVIALSLAISTSLVSGVSHKLSNLQLNTLETVESQPTDSIPAVSSVYPDQLDSLPGPPALLESDPETLAPTSLTSELSSLSPALFQNVNIPDSVYQPYILSNQNMLMEGTTPAALYVGGEYCENCAAMRWAIVVAFSQFGTFSHLAELQSSVANISTFSFHGASYQSPYLDFQMVERFGNDSQHISQITLAQLELWNDFSSFDQSQWGVPFLDIGNKVFYDGSDFNYGVLSGLSQSQIASDLTDPSSIVAKNILGAALFLVAGICSITNNQPSSVCMTQRVLSTERFLSS